MGDLNVNLDHKAFALRPVRIVKRTNSFKFYTAMMFFPSPWHGCELWLRRCKAFGYLVDDRGDLIIDVLDWKGDIIQDFAITNKGFEFLRQKLKFVVESTDATH